MTEAFIRDFIAPYLSNVQTDPTLKRRKSLEDARRDFAFIEYYDFGANRLLRKYNTPCGLRNIGNTCYFNMFVQLLNSINCLRDTFVQAQPEFVKDPLSTELQCLFAKLYLSKFAYADPSGVFEALNSVSVNNIHLGDQYDFYEYFSLTLDALEKCLAREPAFDGKDKLLQKVFYGSLNQHLLNGKVISTITKDNASTATKFSIINLDVKHSTLERAFEAFRNYAVEGYKSNSGIDTEAQVKSEITSFPGVMIFSVNRVGIQKGQLEKDNSQFTFPTHLAFNRANNTFLSTLSKDEEDIERQIEALQRAIKEGRNQTYLQSLKKTLEFLEIQERVTPERQYYCAFPLEADLTPTKRQVLSYISKLYQNEIYLRQKLKYLEDQKYQKTASKDFRNYSLMAAMIHDGNANGGHYYMFIYNENTRLWHRYSDREVTPSSKEEVMQTALGLIKPETNVSCLVYKSSDIKCDPTVEPNISQKIRNFVRDDDEMLSHNIDRIRLDRMLRNSAELAAYYTETRLDALKTDPMTFVSYFADPSFFFVSNGYKRKAELYRLRKLITDPSFVEELRVSRLSKTGTITIPKIDMGADSDYCYIIDTIKMALNEYCRCTINTSLMYLAVRRSKKFQKQIVKDMLDLVVYLFLLKSCFYIDLMIQKSLRIGYLYELIKYINKSMPECIFTKQVNYNLRHSLYSAGIKYTDKVISMKLTESIFEKAKPAEYVDIERLFNTRFALWMNFYRYIWRTKATISQYRRQHDESVLLVQYASST